MKYVVPNWEREFLLQPWHVQKWCLVKAEDDLKKVKRQHRFNGIFLVWCVAWLIFEMVVQHGWWSVGFAIFYSVFIFLYWHLWKATKRKIKVVTAVHERMKELIASDP